MVGDFQMRNAVVLSMIMLATLAGAQGQSASGGSQPSGQQSMPGMDMSDVHHDMSKMKDMPADTDNADEINAGAPATHSAMNSMEGHMDMGPHMKMTALRPPKPGDSARAQEIAAAARKAAEQYKDYRVALADGFKIFLPNVPQKMYHFTNYRYGIEAGRHFNPEHPTSLLYEKHGDAYTLVGVMYTAPKRLNEDELNERIPLSVAQWHEHVNFCVPPLGRGREMFQANPKFGFRGSITTQEACDAAGGRFRPVVLNWMVHVYPFEKDQASIWSVERQHGDAD